MGPRKIASPDAARIPTFRLIREGVHAGNSQSFADLIRKLARRDFPTRQNDCRRRGGEAIDARMRAGET